MEVHKKLWESSDVPSTCALYQLVYISETNDVNTTKETNQELRCLYIKKLKKLIVGQLNINSLRNEFDLLTYQIKDNIGMLMITETKLDESFSIGQFFINGLAVL